MIAFGEVVEIKPVEVPVIRTFGQFEAAIGSLATEDYACDFRVENNLPHSVLNDDNYHEKDLTLRAIKFLLSDQHPNLEWTYNGPNDLYGSTPRNDIGLHHDYDNIDVRYDDPDDPLSPEALYIGYHVTLPGQEGHEQDFGVTFASPKAAYRRSNDRYLNGLLTGSAPRTDSGLVIPTSFRTRRLENGGAIGFTFKRPQARAQLHGFRTFSARRDSSITTLVGTPVRS